VTQSVIKYEDGEAYERGMGIWSQLAGQEFFGWLAPEPGLRWLDVGCGSGAFTELIARQCAPSELQGLDPAEAQLDYARQRLGTRGAMFHQGDAMALPFEDGGFDAAVMALVIFFVPDPSKGVAEMARVTRPGGTVSSYAWDFDGGGFPYEPIQAEMRAVGMTPPRPPSPDASHTATLISLWESAGLEEIQSSEIKVRRTFVDFEDFWSASTGTGALKPTISAMAQEDLAQLKAKVKVKVGLGLKANGPVTHEGRANVIQGRVPTAR
jgi:SAM-dependent methyltransferase